MLIVNTLPYMILQNWMIRQNYTGLFDKFLKITAIQPGVEELFT